MNGARRVLACAALLGVLAGCAGPAAPSPPTAAPPTAAPTAPPSTGPAADRAFCAAHGETASAVRSLLIPALESNPILPQAIALLLLGSRDRATAPGLESPELVAAQAELRDAIDDIDAQARAMVPPGGDAAREVVRPDTTRLAAAVDAIELICGTPT